MPVTTSSVTTLPARAAASSFTITPRGPFSLAEAAMFGFGQRAAPAAWDGVMRLAFCADGYAGHAGVEVRQDEAGAVHCVTYGAGQAEPELIRAQVERVLSLDHDGEQFSQVGRRDPVIGRLQAAAPGLRPPLFYSPYEAAAWSVLSSRRPASLMMRVRDRLSRAHGASFDLAGQRLAAFPAPEALLGVTSFSGIAEERMRRLHGVARAALDGQLDAGRLLELGPDRAMTRLREISGIGPFYSSLIVIRGTGFADVLPVNEPRLLSLTTRLYELGTSPGPDQFRALAEPWRPLRTWTAVLIRAATGRILADPADSAPPRLGGRPGRRLA